MLKLNLFSTFCNNEIVTSIAKYFGESDIILSIF